MGLLITLRESWADFLRTDAASAAYFNADPAIPIFTEKLKSIEQAIIDVQKKFGLNIVIMTVVARDRQNQVPGLWFKNVVAVARVIESPLANTTGICASDLAEAIAYFSGGFKLYGKHPMKLQDIALAPVPAGVAYDVIYSVQGGIEEMPTRPALPDAP